MRIEDPHYRDAVAAIDGGDPSALRHLLDAHPRLVRDRLDGGEGYFARPYLLWFVAENPVRNGRLPGNIVEVTRVIVHAAERRGAATLREQLDGALGLVCSGRVVRECGVQGGLIDLLVDSGADPDGALVPALAHREIDAAGRLLERGARLTLLAAICAGQTDDVARLLPAADAAERQAALIGAAFYGRADALAALIDSGVDVNAYGPPGFHPHATALHQAVDSGSMEAVKLLLAAGADVGAKDRVYQGTPLGWAEHLGRDAIAACLRAAGERR